MTRRITRLVLAALAISVTGPSASPQGCLGQPVATAMLRDDDGFITMPVTIGDQTASLLVDTGSDSGLLTELGAARLGLAPDRQRRTLMHGTGGTGRIVPNVLYPGIRIGNLALPGGSLPVSGLPGMPVVSPPVAGLIGADLLARFDLELDLPQRRIVLWHMRPGSVACAPPPAWDGRFDTIPLARHGDRVSFTASLDGRPISVLVDSGARSRILSTRAASRLGVDAARLGVDPGGVTAGIDLHEAEYHWHRFDRLVIGHEGMPRPVLTVAPLDEPFDLLLGADWFATRDVWISYATGRLFVRPGRR